jgi:PmbA protein
MVDKERLLAVVEVALQRAAAAGATQAEAAVTAADIRLTRFATNYIHQNVAETDAGLSMRVVVGKKVGRAATNVLDEASISACAARAVDIARLRPDDPHFRSLPAPEPISEVDGWVAATHDYSPEQRAKAVGGIISAAKAGGFEAAGAFTTGGLAYAVGNSLGVRAHFASTMASANTVVMSPTSSGYASGNSRDVRQLDLDKIARTAVDKCAASVDPVKGEIGEYEVVLEEDAVAQMLAFLGWMGFSAMSYQEGRSFLCGKLGEKVTGENISIWDDGADPSGSPLPFDAEGMPKRKLSLIEDGVGKNVCYDSYTAGRDPEPGRKSTGHSAGPMGPMPANLFLKTGDASVEDMIAATKRGILVTRFHYTNPLHPVKTLITGMTRDGTFLIENGRVTKALKNYRFTQSVLDALSNVQMIGRVPKLITGFRGGIVAPALKIGKFNFTGVTEF